MAPRAVDAAPTIEAEAPSHTQMPSRSLLSTLTRIASSRVPSACPLPSAQRPAQVMPFTVSVQPPTRSSFPRMAPPPLIVVSTVISSISASSIVASSASTTSPPAAHAAISSSRVATTAT